MIGETSNVTEGCRCDVAEVHPQCLNTDYKAPYVRMSERPLNILPHVLSEVTSPGYGYRRKRPLGHDLSRRHRGESFGEHSVVLSRNQKGERTYV